MGIEVRRGKRTGKGGEGGKGKEGGGLQGEESTHAEPGWQQRGARPSRKQLQLNLRHLRRAEAVVAPQEAKGDRSARRWDRAIGAAGNSSSVCKNVATHFALALKQFLSGSNNRH